MSRIYAGHFGLKGRPFSLVPDPDFMFWSSGHKHAYAMLEYGLESFAPIILITGEVGAGKTTLIRYLLRAAPRHLGIGLISNANGQRGALLNWALSSLGQPVGGRTSYVGGFARFQSFLVEEAAAGRHTVLIVDEAQNLSDRMLEELRCFSNLNDESHELLQIILVGQPELRRAIGRPKLEQFAQRVSADFHLSGMDRDGVHAYIAHRLDVVGATGEIFTPAACDVIYEASLGLPRIVNQLCDNALVYAFAEDATTICAEIAKRVTGDRAARWQPATRYQSREPIG